MVSLSKLGSILVGYGGIGSLFYFKSLKQRLGIVIAMYIYAKMKGGSEHSILQSLYGINKLRYNIRGYVKPGYEKVREVYEQNFKDGMERGSQCCIYIKGEKVVDLVGTTQYAQNYNEDTLQIVFSVSKCLETVVIAMLVDRGLLRYDQKIVEVWPEFGKHGKENTTLEQILRHEARLPTLGEKPTVNLVQRDEIKKNSIGKIVEESKPKQYKEGQSHREYHAVSRGLILNEIVRRVDPDQRTMGEFIEEEINQVLGVSYNLGIKEEKLEQVTENKYTLMSDPLWAVFQSMVPQAMGSKMMLNFLQLLGVFVVLAYVKFQAPFDIKSKLYKLGEYPSSSGITNARSLAKIASALSRKGKVDNDVQLFSEKTAELFHSEPIVRHDNVFRCTSKFNRGGNNVFTDDQKMGRFGDKKGFVGWSGLGGSMIQWHPGKEIGFSYTVNLCDVDQCFVRGLKVRMAAYECAEKLEKEE